VKKYLCTGLLSLCAFAFCGGCGSSSTSSGSNTPNAKYFAYIPTTVSTPVTSPSNILTYSFDPSTGALTAVGTPLAIPRSAIAVDPTGKFAYVASIPSGTGAGSIQAFAIDASTGELTTVGSPVATGIYPFSVVVDPIGKFAYVGNGGINNSSISAYTIGSDGTLTAVPGSPFNGVGFFNAYLVMAPLGKFIYVPANGGVSVYAVNSSTGGLTLVAGNPPPPGPLSELNALALNATGNFAFLISSSNSGDPKDCASSISTFSVDGSTGTLTASNSMPGVGCNSASLAVSGSYAYVSTGLFGGLSTYSIDLSTGTLTALGSPINAAFTSVFVDPTGRYLYGLDTIALSNAVFSGELVGYSINPSTGALAQLSGPPISAGGTGLMPLGMVFAKE
jgi:6-phosphogluconolactonase (cycloisomerase 2 family)